MVAALSIDETVAYEALAGVEKLNYERDWATARWRWKRYAHLLAPMPGWSTWWVYRSDLELDPIYLDSGHKWNSIWHEMTELVEFRDAVKFLFIAGNSASAQTGAIVAAKEPEEATVETAPEFQTAEEYAASRASVTSDSPTGQYPATE